jgi:hypothetical protein
MSHTTSIRRAASMLGATGLIALSMAAPANARQVPGNGDWAEQHCSLSCFEGPQPGPSRIIFRPTDDNAVEVLQLGAGVLAGIALAGAAAAAASRRNHAHMGHPA